MSGGIRKMLKQRMETYRAEQAELAKIRKRAKLRGTLKGRADRWKKKVKQTKQEGYDEGYNKRSVFGQALSKFFEQPSTAKKTKKKRKTGKGKSKYVVVGGKAYKMGTTKRTKKRASGKRRKKQGSGYQLYTSGW